MAAQYGPAQKNINLELLHKLQKRAARTITCANYGAHSKPIFHELDMLE